MSKLEQYKEDLPALTAGRLEPARAAEILRAAESDDKLREAIENERALDRVLDMYAVPEMSDDFERRFWKRFHESKVYGEDSGKSGWVLRLAAPVAACALIAIGVILFVNNDSTDPGSDTPNTAEVDDAGEEDTTIDEVVWEGSEFTYVAGGDTDAKPDRLDLETLEHLKLLDENAEFQALDDLQSPEDLAVIDDMELLTELSDAELND